MYPFKIEWTNLKVKHFIIEKFIIIGLSKNPLTQNRDFSIIFISERI